jgi:hemin uptake protein HemP
MRPLQPRMRASTRGKERQMMPSNSTCKHQDGSPCHCSAQRLLHWSGWIESDYLFAGRDEVKINHGGETYQLRIAENGNLVLHKD